jgi:hypothetical protein
VKIGLIARSFIAIDIYYYGRCIGQPPKYMRFDLEDLLGLKDEAKLGDAES